MYTLCRQYHGGSGGCLVCILFAGRTAGGCPASVCTFYRIVSALYAYFFVKNPGLPSVCTFWRLRLGLWCLASVCTFSQSAAALYAYFLQTKRGCLVYALFARCGCLCGVRLVYALFLFPCLLPRCPASVCIFLRKKKKYVKKKGKRGRFMYAHYGRKEFRLVYALYGAKSEARRLV